MDLSIDCLLPPDNEFQKLDLLLSQGSFELVNYQPDQKVQDLKLVYLMNDAAESFLVFQKARLTVELSLRENVPQRSVCMVYDRQHPLSAAAKELKSRMRQSAAAVSDRI